MKAAIYARFSSDKQSDRSIEDQIALCRALCAREGLTIAGLYEDRAISGASTLNRMGWQRLMRDARSRKFSVVVAEALDRISRDQEDLAGIHKRLSFAGIRIMTVQDGRRRRDPYRCQRTAWGALPQRPCAKNPPRTGRRHSRRPPQWWPQLRLQASAGQARRLGD
jgi:Resolvase, N terminal domain